MGLTFDACGSCGRVRKSVQTRSGVLGSHSHAIYAQLCATCTRKAREKRALKSAVKETKKP